MSFVLIKPYKQEPLDHAFRVWLRVPDTFNQGDYLTVNVYDTRAVRFRPGAHVRAGSNIFIDVNEQTFNNSQTLHQWYDARQRQLVQARAVARAQQQQLLRLQEQNRLLRQQEAAEKAAAQAAAQAAAKAAAEAAAKAAAETAAMGAGAATLVNVGQDAQRRLADAQAATQQAAAAALARELPRARAAAGLVGMGQNAGFDDLPEPDFGGLGLFNDDPHDQRIRTIGEETAGALADLPGGTQQFLTQKLPHNQGGQLRRVGDPRPYERFGRPHSRRREFVDAATADRDASIWHRKSNKGKKKKGKGKGRGKNGGGRRSRRRRSRRRRRRSRRRRTRR